MSEQDSDETPLASLATLLAGDSPDPVLLVASDGVVLWSNPAADARYAATAGGTAAGERLELGEPVKNADPALPHARFGRFRSQAGQPPLRLIPVPGSDRMLAVGTAGPDAPPHADAVQTSAAEQRERDHLDRSFKVDAYLNRKLLHRVKNNLALLGAITRYRAAATEDEGVKSALRAIYQRIGAIALVHEVLDHGRTVDVLDLSELLRELAVHLQATLSPAGMSIQTDARPITLSVADATPLVLLVNELVGNLLHAAARPVGRIIIRLSRASDTTLRVCVVLHDAEAEPLPLGPEVEALSRQLRGTLVSATEGPGWSLEFPPTPLGPGS